MEKLTFTNEDTGEDVDFYIIEQTTLGAINYLLVSESPDGDCDAYIMKQTNAGEDEVFYDMLEDGEELEAIGNIFAQILEDEDMKLE